MRDGYLYLQRRYAEIFSGDEVSELSDERRAELKAQAIFGTPDDVVAELDRTARHWATTFTSASVSEPFGGTTGDGRTSVRTPGRSGAAEDQLGLTRRVGDC